MCELEDGESSECRVDESKCGISYQEMVKTRQGQDQMVTDFFNNISYIQCDTEKEKELHLGKANLGQKVDKATGSTEPEKLTYILMGSTVGGITLIFTVIAFIGFCVYRQNKPESPHERFSNKN